MVSVYDHMKGLLEDDVVHERAYQDGVEGHPVGDVHAFAGFDRVGELEAEYLPAEDLEKYAHSEGYDPTA